VTLKLTFVIWSVGQNASNRCNVRWKQVQQRVRIASKHNAPMSHHGYHLICKTTLFVSFTVKCDKADSKLVLGSFYHNIK